MLTFVTFVTFPVFSHGAVFHLPFQDPKEILRGGERSFFFFFFEKSPIGRLTDSSSADRALNKGAHCFSCFRTAVSHGVFVSSGPCSGN
jgi:hypothetical protein